MCYSLNTYLSIRNHIKSFEISGPLRFPHFSHQLLLIKSKGVAWDRDRMPLRPGFTTCTITHTLATHKHTHSWRSSGQVNKGAIKHTCNLGHLSSLLAEELFGSPIQANYTVTPKTIACTEINHDAPTSSRDQYHCTAVSWQSAKHAFLMQLTLTRRSKILIHTHESPQIAFFSQSKNSHLKVNNYIFSCVKDQEHLLSSTLCNFLR